MIEAVVAPRVVAIVDDDPFIRAGLGRLVRSLGYGALLFEGAEPFLSYSAEHQPFCVLVDLQMPGMGGIELIQALSAYSPSLPVAAMTAFPNDVVRQRALEAGAQTYLTKPFDAAVLESYLSGLASRSDLR